MIFTIFKKLVEPLKLLLCVSLFLSSVGSSQPSQCLRLSPAMDQTSSPDVGCVNDSGVGRDDLHTSIHTEHGLFSGQYIRSPLARAVYYKIKEDEFNKNDRHVYVSQCIFILLEFRNT